MVDIVTMRGPNKPYKDASKVEFGTLTEYLVIAKKVIKFFGKKYGWSTVQNMLNSDDEVANIAYVLMQADWRWDDKHIGKGGLRMTKKSYRNYCALCAIKYYIQRRKRMGKHKTLSLDAEYGSGHSFGSNMIDIKALDPADVAEETDTQSSISENVNRLLSSGILLPIQEKFLRLHHLDGMSQADIARQEGVSREYVRQVVNKAVARLSNNDELKNLADSL